MSGEEEAGALEGLSGYDHIRLTVSSTMYTVARALRVNKVKDRLGPSHIVPSKPLWMLGKRYDIEGGEPLQQHKAFLDHFESLQWLSYRTHFTPIAIGASQLRTDAGWGCTLRSGQMMVAQGLQRAFLGSTWRPLKDTGNEVDSEPPEELLRLLRVFWDAPSHRNPLSIHNLCRYGRDAGVIPGKWLGPWTACKSLAAAWEATNASVDYRIDIEVLAEPGGVPVLNIPRFDATWSHGEDDPELKQDSLRGAQRVDVSMAEFDAQCAHFADPLRKDLNDTRETRRGLLLLVPLVLGLGKLNSVYIPQLKAVLSMPQCVGFIGGRPSSSLYFVGYQEDSILYLDPHQVQEAACSDGDWKSFSSGLVSGMSFQDIDPSLALGFYCGSKEEYTHMYQQLAELESKSVGAPLVCVSSNAFTPDVYLEREPSIWEPDDLDSNEASCIDQDAPDSQPQPSAPPPNSPGQAEVAAISERPSAYEEAALTAASAEEIPGTFPEDHPARDGQGPTPAPTPTRLLPTRSSGWELL